LQWLCLDYTGDAGMDGGYQGHCPSGGMAV
jgi:hypothetical protein